MSSEVVSETRTQSLDELIKEFKCLTDRLEIHKFCKCFQHWLTKNDEPNFLLQFFESIDDKFDRMDAQAIFLANSAVKNKKIFNQLVNLISQLNLDYQYL
jgi:hypothetical protein